MTKRSRTELARLWLFDHPLTGHPKWDLHKRAIAQLIASGELIYNPDVVIENAGFDEVSQLIDARIKTLN